MQTNKYHMGFFYLLSNSQKKQCFDFYLQRQPQGKIIEIILITSSI